MSEDAKPVDVGATPAPYVFIVAQGYDYEGEVLYGVFLTAAEALAAQATLLTDAHADSVEVTEWLVGRPEAGIVLSMRRTARGLARTANRPRQPPADAGDE